MSRPMYEVPSDVDKEIAVMDKLVSKYPFEVEYFKLPKHYQLDYGVYRERLILLTEIKCRDIRFNTYPTVILSAHKMHAMIEWYVRGIKSVLLYQMNDGLFAYNVDTDAYQLPIHHGGRKDRNDWQDVEPVYHIDTKLLRLVE